MFERRATWIPTGSVTKSGPLYSRISNSSWIIPSKSRHRRSRSSAVNRRIRHRAPQIQHRSKCDSPLIPSFRCQTEDSTHDIGVCTCRTGATKHQIKASAYSIGTCTHSVQRDTPNRPHKSSSTSASGIDFAYTRRQ